MVDNRPLVALRLALFCATIFAALGVYAPFWPVWLRERGLSSDQIAVLLAIPSGIRVITAPLLARRADQSGRRRRLTLQLAWAAALCFALFPLAGSFATLFVVSCAFGITFTALMPLSDQSIIASARAHAIQYGRIRVWGSVSFLLLSLIGGQLLEGRSAQVVFAAILTALVVAAASGHLLPPFDTAPVPKRERATLRETWQVPGLARVLLAYGLAMGSHATFSAFSTLHWRALGIGDDVIGLLWAEGVVAEIVLFTLGTRLAARLGARGLLLAGCGAAVLRWTLMPATSSVWALLLLQTTHALTFGAVHLGAMDYIARRCPERLSTTALGLAAATSGLFNATLMLASGPLFRCFAGAAFFAMIVPAATAIALCWKRLPEGRVDPPTASLTCTQATPKEDP